MLFGIKNLYTLFGVLVNNVRGYFMSFVVFFQPPQEKYEQWVKCLCVLLTKTPNKSLIIRLYFVFALSSFSKKNGQTEVEQCNRPGAYFVSSLALIW